MDTFKFPKDFLWGTSTAGHQIEGNNKNSDWWAWEHRDKSKDCLLVKKLGMSKLPLEPSLDAADSYHRYEEDFDLAVKLNNNAIRFGIEWSRLEPKPGEFDQKEFEHYKKVMKAARDRGLKTFVTLHHFTSPNWLAKKGGWVPFKSIKYFARYAKKCAEEFGDLIDVYLTINEPQVYATGSYLVGRWPPQKFAPVRTVVVMGNMLRAHKKAYKAIKSVGNYQVGLVKNIAWFERHPDSKNPLGLVLAALLRYLSSDYFLQPIKKHLDLIGLNYYFTNYVNDLNIKSNPNTECSDLGWWLETSGLRNILIDLKKYKLPIYITENGLADCYDSQRTWYIHQAISRCAEALEHNVPLKGYFHWTLIDNYEWAEGYHARFGLVEIDRENNLQRKPRPSFYEYSKICENGTIKR